MNQLFRAFQHRNYRLYWYGFALSLMGTWMQQLAQSWLVWRLTESPLWLGIIGAMPQLPSLLLGSIGVMIKGNIGGGIVVALLFGSLPIGLALLLFSRGLRRLPKRVRVSLPPVPRAVPPEGA